MRGDFLPQACKMNKKEKFISINNGTPIKCITIDSLIIEGKLLVLILGYIFLNELIQECLALGVKFVRHTFKNIEDVKDLKENVIFNCLGLGSRYVFNDVNMVPVKG